MYICTCSGVWVRGSNISPKSGRIIDCLCSKLCALDVQTIFTFFCMVYVIIDVILELETWMGRSEGEWSREHEKER